MNVDRSHWLNHVRDVVRSRHYTWLPQGLGGRPVDEAMTYLLTDVMHVCKLAGVRFEAVVEQARVKFEEEERGGFPSGQPAAEESSSAQTPPIVDGDEVVVVYTTNDVYDAEIVRGVLQSEGISSRVDSSAQGGFTELVDVKILAHARDADRASAAIHRKAATYERTRPSDESTPG